MRKKVMLITLTCIFILTAVSMVMAAEKSFTIYESLDVYENKTGKTIDEFHESPELQEKVAAGELPPVEERLPEQPLVLGPSEAIGKYGGTMDRVWTGPSDEWNVYRFMGERFNFWDENMEVYPNVPLKSEVRDDGYTIWVQLRKGLKWSDGTPVTSEDAEFGYTHVIARDGLNYPYFITTRYQDTKGEYGELKVIDEYTFEITFSEPMAQSVMWGLAGDCPISLILPKHYLKDFHGDFADAEVLEEKVEKAGFNSWMDYFEFSGDFLRNSQVPVLWAWIPVTSNPDSSVIKYRRNPYYWQVDPEGNQLPYIDEIRFSLIEDANMSVMKAVSGQLDFQARHIPLSELSTLIEHQEDGGFRIYLGRGDAGSALSLMPNQNVKDDSWKKELFQNKRFRHALSLAINREEINEMEYLGLGMPRQASPIPQSPFYSPEWESAYAEYDPDKAIEILENELGLTEKNRNGYRVRSDNGEPIRLILDTSADSRNVSALELIKRYLEKVGLQTIINTMDGTLYFERTLSADNDISIWSTDRMLRPDLSPRWWAIVDKDNHHYCSLWGLWDATDGKEGEEPPEHYKRLQEISKQLPAVFDMEERKELMAEVSSIMSDELYIIGTVGGMPQVYVINKDIKNIPEDIYVGGEDTRAVGYMMPQNLFFDN